jgi:predicted RNA-binding protein associated with RNAse of E/G family
VTVSLEVTATPQNPADVRELVDRLNRGEITAEDFFKAVERRAHRLVEDDASLR